MLQIPNGLDQFIPFFRGKLSLSLIGFDDHLEQSALPANLCPERFQFVQQRQMFISLFYDLDTPG